MTRDEILAMEPGPQMNELIAVKVFGQGKPPYVHEPHIDPRWDGHWVCCPSYGEGDVCHWEARDFSGDIAAAWPVVEEVSAIPNTIEAARHAANTRFMFLWEQDAVWAMTAKEAAEFICKAALLAVMEADDA